MKRGLLMSVLAALALAAAAPAFSVDLPYMPRQDATWARVAPAAPTLDGVLNEPSWALAESTVIRFGLTSSMIPGSGWKIEATAIPPSQFDSTYAVVKYLAYGNQIYMGFRVKDKYIGGSVDFNRFDGLLMCVKDHTSLLAPKPPAEYFYAWWYPHLTDPQPAGQLPRFIGKFGETNPGDPRTPEQIAAWNAVTVVHGTSNDDSTPDQGYTIEMVFDCAAVGYDITKPGGDIFEWNCSVYDCDGWWPYTPSRFSATRTWVQGPWGNSNGYNEVRLMSRPDVTTATNPLPVIAPEIHYPRLAETATIDGQLSDPVWSNPYVYSFDIRWGDDALRQTYPAIGPVRAGQWQPTVNGGEAYVADPGDATVKMFVSGDKLYCGFDVRDKYVQYIADQNRWDGLYVMLTEIDSLQMTDHALASKRLGFQVGPNGTVIPHDYLVNLIAAGKAQLGLQLKAGTVVDTLGIDIDTGYTAELAVDLTDFGYTPGHVVGPLFLGVVLYDGDSFESASDSYGTKTWWFREYDNTCCPPWGYVTDAVTAVSGGGEVAAGTYGRADSYPNPSREPLIRYYLPERNRVTFEVYDLRGRLVERRQLGTVEGGERQLSLFGERRQASGVYLYRLRIEDPVSGRLRGTLTGKTLVID